MSQHQIWDPVDKWRPPITEWWVTRDIFSFCFPSPVQWNSAVSLAAAGQQSPQERYQTPHSVCSLAYRTTVNWRDRYLDKQSIFPRSQGLGHNSQLANVAACTPVVSKATWRPHSSDTKAVFPSSPCSESSCTRSTLQAEACSPRLPGNSRLTCLFCRHAKGKMKKLLCKKTSHFNHFVLQEFQAPEVLGRYHVQNTSM